MWKRRKRMGIRNKIIDYSRGNDLDGFFRLYKWQKRIKSGIVHDILTFFMSRSANRHGGYIGPDAVIKGRPSLPHGLHGIFISRYAQIGENCRIYQNVTIGEVNRKAPVIGDNCLIGAGAVILGGIRVGNHAKIGAGAVVCKDIPDGCTVVSQTARILGKDDTDMDNGHLAECTYWTEGASKERIAERQASEGRASERQASERAWIEVSLSNLRHNAKVLQKAMPVGCELMAVVKCEAYGHGGILMAKELERTGIKAFAVATIEEAVRLRENGIGGEILILGHTDVQRARDLYKYDLMQSIIGYAYAQALQEQGRLYGVAVKAHIKIDTGMHRLGISARMPDQVSEIFAMSNIEVCGIYTHLCCADGRQSEDIVYTKEQIGLFYRLIDTLKQKGIHIPKLHIQSSYGLLNYPDLQCDYVRAGIALYGVLSTPEKDTLLKPFLRPVLSLKSRVVLIRFVKKGESIGYGRQFAAKRDSRIAILPVGYGDGYPGDLSCGKGRVLLGGHLVPVIGRICMDQLAVDITEAEEVREGDTAILIGGGEEAMPAAPEVAAASGRISNELLCRLGARLPVVPVE